MPEWKNVGNIKGEKGDPGDKGDKGDAGQDAVVDSGDNYIQFSDGTLMCFMEVDLTYQSGETMNAPEVDFPQPFESIPYVQSSIAYEGTDKHLENLDFKDLTPIYMYNLEKSRVSIGIKRDVSRGEDFTENDIVRLHIIAVGKG